MSGFMRKAAFVVGAVALIASTAGLAAPAVAATATTAASAGGIAGVSAATLTAIGTYGGLASGVLSAISVATAPKASTQGSATSFQTNPQSGLPYAIGRTRMSGLRMFAGTNTRPGYTKFNDLLWFGALLSIGGQIGGIEKFTIDNEVVTFDASGNAVGTYHDYQGQKIHLGGAPMASALALSLGGGAAPGWTFAHKLSGITHAMWCLRYNKQGEMYGAGAPEPAWIGKWVRVYDPRLDSSYPGGSGPCRALDESTYVWSDNPALHALTWALGRWQNGKRTCGIGAPVANIRVAEFVECANVCEANAWKAGGVEWTTDSKWDTLKRMLQAGGARPTQTGAMIGCLVSMPRTAIATIESRHLLDSLSIAATKSRRDRFNSVIPRYVDEDSDWSMISGTVVSVPEYVAADGGARTKEIDYPLVQVFSGQIAMQPGQLAAYDIVNSREAGPINFTTGPEWIGLKTGDVVLLNVPEEGLAYQPVLITRRAPDPSTGKVAFSAETETYAKHAYALGQSTTPPAPFSLTAPDLKPPAPAAESWAAVGTVTGEGLPAIVVTGNADMPSADAVLIDYKLPTDQVWTRAAILSANDSVLHVISPLESGTAYDLQVGYRVEGIDGDFTQLYAVTGAGKLSTIEEGATVGATPAERDKLTQLETATAAAQAAIAQAQQDIAEISGAVEGDFGPLMQAVNDLENEVDAVQGDISSLQSATGAIQTSVNTLQGQISSAQGNISSLQSQAANIVSSVSDLSDQIIAQGGQISTINSTLSTHGASITSLQTTVSNTAGDVATLKTQITAGGGNLLTNTDLAADVSGWSFDTGHAGTGDRVASGDPWMVVGENGLRTIQPNTGTSSQSDWTQNVAIEALKWYDVSVYAASHRANIQIYLQFINASGAVISTASAGPFAPAGGGNTLTNFVRRSFKAQAPANTVSGKLFLRKFGTLSGTDSYAWWLRPQVAETLATSATPLAYSPGSGKASIVTQATAISSLGTTVSALSTTVSTQGGSITTLQSSVTTLQGSVSTLSSTVSTQGSSITSLQTAVSTAQGDLATLKTQVSAGGGNLLVNTDLAADTSAWAFSGGGIASGDRIGSGDPWVVTGENGLRINQPNGTTSGFSEWVQFVAVEAGKWYDVSCRAAAHRATIQVYLQWYDANNTAGAAPSSGQITPLSGGTALAGWTQIGFKAQAPAGAVRGRFILRKFGTLSGASEATSYAWFIRPQVVETLATSASPLAYAPGSARAVIDVQATALATLNSSFASLTTRVGTAEGSITTLQSSMTSANGSISTLQTNVSSLQGSVSTLQQSSTTQAGQISSLQSTVSTQGGQISSNATAITTLSGTVSTLNTVVSASSSPNLCPNGGFENALDGWSANGSAGVPANNFFRTINAAWGSYASHNVAWTGGSSATFCNLTSSPVSGIDAGSTYTVTADADIRANAAGAEAWVQLIWITASGLQYVDGPHRPVGGGIGFDETGGSRVAFKNTKVVPSNATGVQVSLVTYAPNGVTVNSIAWRQVKLERGSVATPYSGEATAWQAYTAYADLNSSFASLSTTVSTQGGSITTLQSSYTSLNGTVSTLSSTVSAQGTGISNLQTATATQAGLISTLQTQVRAGGGNLLVNTDIAIDASGWSFSTGNASNGERVASGDPWIVIGENGLRIHQPNAATGSQSDWTQEIAVEALKWYDVSVYAASHRANIQIYLQFLDASNNVLATPNSGLVAPSGGGNSISAFTVRSFKGLAPSGTVRARLYLRKFGTLSGADSWAWFLRPQVIETTINSSSPVAYSPGSSRATIITQASAINAINSQQASLSTTVATQGGQISTLQNSLTTLTGSVSTLSTTVSTQGSSISTLQTAVTTLSGNVATLTTTVSAGATNLIANGSFANGLNGWTTNGAWSVSGQNDPSWGRYASALSVHTGPDHYASTAAQPAEVGNTYTLTADIDLGGASGGYAFARIVWLTPGGALHAIGPVVVGTGSFTNDFAARQKVSAVCPSGAGQFYVQLGVEGSWSAGNISFRQIKVINGTTIGRFSDEATISQSFEALTTLTTQYASLSSTVSTQGVTISTQATAITTLNGNVATLFGRAAIMVDVAGRGYGIEIAGNQQAGGIRFRSDVIRFEDPDPNTGAMEWYDQAIRMTDGAGKLRMYIGYRA